MFDITCEWFFLMNNSTGFGTAIYSAKEEWFQPEVWKTPEIGDST